MPAKKAAVVEDAAEPTSMLVQATAGSLAVLPVDQIHPHPKNIRHNAVADDELVESIRAQGLLQPLVVAPIGGDELGPNNSGPAYRLIAGHRRLDGIIKAGIDHATAVIRRDLTNEADQVAAMLVENGRRADLTPLEEAEGYGQLRFDFGWKAAEIAKAAGHSVDTINRRLKLLKLDEKVKKTVDTGQLNIDDAIAVAELPKAEQAKVTRATASGNLKWEISQAKDRMKRARATEKQIADLITTGVPRRELPKGVNSWGLTHAEHGMTALFGTFSKDPADHDGCLAFVVHDDFQGIAEVKFVCTDIPKHDEQLDEKRRAERIAEEEREQAERAAAEAARLAAQLRLDTVVDMVRPGVKLDPQVTDVLSVFVPTLLRRLDQTALARYFDAVNLPAEQRWSTSYHQRKKADVALFRTHVEQVVASPGYALLRTLILALAVHVESTTIPRLGYAAKSTHSWERDELADVLALIGLLDRSGYQLTDIDIDIRATAADALGDHS